MSDFHKKAGTLLSPYIEEEKLAKNSLSPTHEIVIRAKPFLYTILNSKNLFLSDKRVGFSHALY